MALKDEHKEHLKGYGPMYTLIVLVLGGGGVATLSDNIPVTQAQFKAWAEEHTGGMHEPAEDAIIELKEGLKTIRLEQVRQQLKQAYHDKCQANDAAARNYIDNEIRRLRGIYYSLTGREYDPPPCISN